MKLLANLSLGKKIALLTVLELIVALGLFSYLGMRAVSGATEAMLQDRLTTASLVADYLDETLGRALAELENTAHILETEGAGYDPGPRVLAFEEACSHLSIFMDDVYLIDDQGKVTWSRKGMTAFEMNTSPFYPYVIRAIVGGNALISGLVTAPVTSTPVVLLTCPFGSGQAAPEGMIIAAIDLASSGIGGFIQPLRLGETGYAEIIDENGIVVVRTEPGPRLAPFEKSDHSGRFAALIAAGKPTRGLCHTCHEPVYRVERRDVLAFAPLSGVRWGVVIRQSEKEALAPVRELRESLLLTGSALAGMVLLSVMFIRRDIIRRISILTTASRRIAGGDLVTSIRDLRQDEIGLLGESLEEMRSRLRDSYTELEKRTEEMASLLAVSKILTSLADLSDLEGALGGALDKTLEVTGQDMGAVLLVEEESGSPVCRAQRGFPEGEAKMTCIQSIERIAAKVVVTRNPVLLDKVAGAPGDPFLTGAFAAVPLLSKERVLGVLGVASRDARRISEKDLRLLEGIAGQVATAVENARLHQEARQQDEDRGELLHEIYSIQEEERRRIARELHDEMSQLLASLNANLAAASGLLPVEAIRAQAMLKKAQTLSINVLEEIHRLIYELRPTLLDDLGLVPAVRWLADNSLRAAGIRVMFRATGTERRLSPPLETALFRVIQEAFGNIVRHGQARSAHITLQFNENNIKVNIKDNGRGFDVGEALSTRDRPRGLGLLGMRERVDLYGGTLNIHSQPGSGTEIDIEIPASYEGAVNEQD